MIKKFLFIIPLILTISSCSLLPKVLPDTSSTKGHEVKVNTNMQKGHNSLLGGDSGDRQGEMVFTFKEGMFIIVEPCSSEFHMDYQSYDKEIKSYFAYYLFGIMLLLCFIFSLFALIKRGK